MLKNKKGQSLIEYAIVVVLVASAVTLMSTYVFRSIQATVRMVEGDFRDD